MKDYCDCGSVLMHDEKEECSECYIVYRREEEQKKKDERGIVAEKSLEAEVETDLDI